MSNKRSAVEVRIAVLGQTGVGKSSIVSRKIRNQFTLQPEETTGVAFNRTVVHLEDDKHVIMNIWDTSGKEKYSSLIPAYCTECVAAMVVFDLTDRSTFHHVYKYVDKLRLYAGENIQIFLVGNKLNQQGKREVSSEEAQRYADQIRAVCYYETSALTGEGVKEVFEKMAEIIHKKSPHCKNSRKKAKEQDACTIL